jgi:hypothetical protein
MTMLCPSVKLWVTDVVTVAISRLPPVVGWVIWLMPMLPTIPALLAVTALPLTV